ncbi:hypothetical protein BKP35_08830 [Anaerobacillus arseniciselenatis]|uniref:Uncharacterized protein n=1 Tax=Anaerobacillus arseniciselenatis TaxID=85682 RepID=A0A1S2LMW0_9BACI|nr:hypothetical protein BKP35_08830 [Anaerobacillus arseniciselenatis]
MILGYFNVARAYMNGVLGEDHSPETHLIPIILQVALGQREPFRFSVMIMTRKMERVLEIIFM